MSASSTTRRIPSPNSGRRCSPLVALVAVLFTAVVLLVSGARTGAQEQHQSYTVTDLGTLPGDSYSTATAINGSGQVVGYSYIDEGYQHAFLYENGQMKDLGTLPGGSWSEAYDINNSGQVVGVSGTSSGQHAFLYENGQMKDLGTLPGGATLSTANAINGSGQVVGYSWTSSGNAHAFLYEDGQMKDLGTLPGGSYSYAEDINGSGQVVGWANTSSGYLVQHAFLYENGQMKDLGTLPGGDSSRAYSINDSGQVVGVSGTSSGQHAFLYENGQMVDLGTLPASHSYPYSRAYGINDSGQVVGDSEPSHAFLYENGQMVDLNDRIPADSGWVLQYARDINNAGQIVGNGVHNGQRRAFLLTPSYAFQGFYQPVDNPPTINVAKARVGIPVKFSLGGDQGLDIFAADYPKSQRIACDSTAPIDRIEQTVSAGASNISYDVATGQYIYVWKTTKAWKGTCRQFTMKLDDGTVHRANFKFK